MKVIDDKGKFLGVVNFLDMIIVLVIALSIGFLIYSKSHDVGLNINNTAEQDILVTFFVSDIRDVSINVINEGDFFKNAETKNTLGQVVGKTVTNTQISTTDNNGNLIYSDIPDRYDIQFTVKGRGSVSDENIMISNEIIQVGKSFVLESKYIRTNGVVFEIEY